MVKDAGSKIKCGRLMKNMKSPNSSLNNYWHIIKETSRSSRDHLCQSMHFSYQPRVSCQLTKAQMNESRLTNLKLHLQWDTVYKIVHQVFVSVFYNMDLFVYKDSAIQLAHTEIVIPVNLKNPVFHKVYNHLSHLGVKRYLKELKPDIIGLDTSKTLHSGWAVPEA